jgi:uncharacterized protein (DUF1800 family)
MRWLMVGFDVAVALAVVGLLWWAKIIRPRHWLWPWVSRAQLDAVQGCVAVMEEVADSLRGILQATREELQTVLFTCRNRGDALARMRAALEAAEWDVAFGDARAEEAGRLFAREQREAARWRQRALDNDANGPTCADVQAVYEENMRLKAQVAAQIGGGSTYLGPG